MVRPGRPSRRPEDFGRVAGAASQDGVQEGEGGAEDGKPVARRGVARGRRNGEASSPVRARARRHGPGAGRERRVRAGAPVPGDRTRGSGHLPRRPRRRRVAQLPVRPGGVPGSASNSAKSPPGRSASRSPGQLLRPWPTSLSSPLTASHGPAEEQPRSSPLQRTRARLPAGGETAARSLTHVIRYVASPRPRAGRMGLGGALASQGLGTIPANAGSTRPT